MDATISDHYVVYFNLATSRLPLPRKTISARSFKSIDLESLKCDIRNSIRLALTSDNPDELPLQYDSELTALMEKHAPIRTQTVAILQLARWYTEDIRSLRRNLRRAEKRLLRSGEIEAREHYRNAKNKLTSNIKVAKKLYYQNKIVSAGKSQKAPFHCVDDLFKNQN